MTPEQEHMFNHYKRKCALYGKTIQKLRCKYGNDEIDAITQEINDYEQGCKEAEIAEEKVNEN